MRKPSMSPTKAAQSVNLIRDKLKRESVIANNINVSNLRRPSFYNTNNSSNLSLTARKSKIGNPITQNPTDFNESFENSDKVMLKDMIENANIETKAINMLNETEELLIATNTYNTKDEKEKYELIEKTVLESIKHRNEKMKIEKNQLLEVNVDINKKLSKTNGELNYMTATYKMMEKTKDKNINEIYKLEAELRQIAISNEKVTEMLRKEQFERANIARAIEMFRNKYNKTLPKDLNEIFENYVKEYNKDNNNCNIDYKQGEKIALLKLKIKQAEKELKLRGEKIEVLKMSLNKS